MEAAVLMTVIAVAVLVAWVLETRELIRVFERRIEALENAAADLRADNRALTDAVTRKQGGPLVFSAVPPGAPAVKVASWWSDEQTPRAEE